MKAFHPDYGLPQEWRIKAVKMSLRYGVSKAAELCRVSSMSIYHWRKRITPAELFGVDTESLVQYGTTPGQITGTISGALPEPDAPARNIAQDVKAA